MEEKNNLNLTFANMRVKSFKIVTYVPILQKKLIGAGF